MSATMSISPARHHEIALAKRTASDLSMKESEPKRIARSLEFPQDTYVITDLRAAKGTILVEHPQLSELALEKIYSYVETHRDLVLCFMRRTNKDFYITPSESGLERAIQFVHNGQILVHLNRKKQGDPYRGGGTFKDVKGCIALDTGVYFASAGFRKATGESALSSYAHFRNVFGFVQLITAIDYSFKRRQLEIFCPPETDFDQAARVYKKHRAVFSFCNSGDLKQAIYQTDSEKQLSTEDRKNIFVGLIHRIETMHSYDLIHRDLSLKNIFLHRDSEGIIDPIIGDLDSMCYDDDEDERLDLATSYSIVPPELVSSAIYFKEDYGVKSSAEEESESSSPPSIASGMEEDDSFSTISTPEDLKIQRFLEDPTGNDADLDPESLLIKKLTTKALDIWCLGCALYELTTKTKLPWMSDQPKAIEVLEKIKEITKDSTWFPEPSEQNSPLHLVWEILSPPFEDRPTIEAIEERMSHINWDLL